MIKKTESGWLVDVQPGGRGTRRFRKSFKTQAEAKAWNAWIATQVTQSPTWSPDKRDMRRLSELVDIWFNNHGNGLSAGEDMCRRLKALVIELGDPMADLFSVEMFAAYRTKRINEGISRNNMNREHAYFRAMFNELIRLGSWTKPNPMATLRQFKIQQNELSYLTKEQIVVLLQELVQSRNKDVLLITLVCLATGARWSEAEHLKKSQIRHGMIQYARTKSGKTRGVPIDESLESKVMEHARANNRLERIFTSSAAAFRKALERSGIDLPAGQMTHVLRHTFASHFMMNGGNILTLQRILGHANVTMTMRYAHLSPEHLQEAKRLNPIANFEEAELQGLSA